MQIKRTYPLSELLKDNGSEDIAHFLKMNFRCERNKDIEQFLHNKAIRFEQARIARSYLIFDEQFNLTAYFTLSFKSIAVKTSKSRLKRLTGGLTNDNKISVYLIGQIGKNSAIKNNPVCLNDILDEILPLIEMAQSISGGRAVILECENNSRLIAHYEKHGFNLIDTENESELKTMFILPEFE